MPGGRSGHGGGGVGCRHNHARTRLAGRKGKKNRNNNGSFLLPGLGAKEHFPPDLVLVPKHMGESIYNRSPGLDIICTPYVSSLQLGIKGLVAVGASIIYPQL